MCATNGNQTICKETRDIIFRMRGTTHVPNKEMRRIIAENGGCLAKGSVDKQTPTQVA